MLQRIVGALLASLALLGQAALAKSAQSWEGLEQRTLKGVDQAWVRPGATLQGYTQVMLDGPIDVAFDKAWDPNQGVRGTAGRLAEDDLQRIRDRMARDFREVFTRELMRGGYKVVDASGPGTLRLRIALTDVYINAPDRAMSQPGRAVTYTLETGRVTLVLEMYDGPTGQLISRVVDEKQDQGTLLEVANSVTNSQEFRRAVDSWSRQLVQALDGVGGKK